MIRFVPVITYDRHRLFSCCLWGGLAVLVLVVVVGIVVALFLQEHGL